jgi:hypothetical protein
MRTPPEFFQGLIAHDFQGLINAEASPGAELAGKEKTPSKTCAPPCKDKPDKPTSPSATCTNPRNPCPPKKKASGFMPAVEGWSTPPAPPAL